jgi:hypothetical protein
MGGSSSSTGGPRKDLAALSNRGGEWHQGFMCALPTGQLAALLAGFPVLFAASEAVL